MNTIAATFSTTDQAATWMAPKSPATTFMPAKAEVSTNSEPAAAVPIRVSARQFGASAARLKRPYSCRARGQSRIQAASPSIRKLRDMKVAVAEPAAPTKGNGDPPGPSQSLKARFTTLADHITIIAGTGFCRDRKSAGSGKGVSGRVNSGG